MNRRAFLSTFFKGVAGVTGLAVAPKAAIAALASLPDVSDKDIGVPRAANAWEDFCWDLKWKIKRAFGLTGDCEVEVPSPLPEVEQLSSSMKLAVKEVVKEMVQGGNLVTNSILLHENGESSTLAQSVPIDFIEDEKPEQLEGK